MARKKTQESPRVYVETSVWGMTLPGQPRALRQPTQKFLAQCRGSQFVSFISTVVLQEVLRAGPHEAQQMLAEINRLAPVQLQPDADSEQLADAYLQAGVIPPKKRDDARHRAHRARADFPLTPLVW
jgi:hypothetical protein